MDHLTARRIHEEVARLCGVARLHHARGEEPEALAAYFDAWELLPEPKGAFRDAATVLAGMSEVLAARGDLSSAMTVLLAARRVCDADLAADA